MALSPTSSHGGGTFNGGTITDGLTIHPPVDTAALSVRANAATTFADLLALQNQAGAYVVEIDSSDDVTIDARSQGGTIGLLAAGGYASFGSGNAQITGRTGKDARITSDGGSLIMDDSGAKITGSIGFYGHAPAAKPTVSGAKLPSDVVLASLLTALVGLGLITDTST